MTTIRIANMTCGGCAKGVTATLRAAGATGEIAVDLDGRQVSTELPTEAAIAALKADGWEATPAG
jgi:copper chaperone